jgi:tetratricopeptide (TPR) repeat protein
MGRAAAAPHRCVLLLSLPLALSPVAGPAAESDLEGHNRRGVEHYEGRRYHQAIESFKKALALDPGNQEVLANLASAWSGLGVEFLNSGENRAALKAFQSAIETRDDFYARFGLGYLHFMELEDERSRDHLQACLALRESFAPAHKLLALIDYRRGDQGKAIQGLERTLALDSGDQEAAAIHQRWKAEAELSREYREERSAGFLIRYPIELGAGRVKEVLAFLDLVRSDWTARFGWRPAGSHRRVVVLFPEEAFHRATGTRHWIGGIFDGQIKAPVSLSSGPEGSGLRDDFELRRSLVHELAHALVKDLYPACPNWLNEGLAQFLELQPIESASEPAWPSRQDLERKRDERGQRIRLQLRENAASRISFSKIPPRLWEVASEAQARWTYVQGIGFVEHLATRYSPFRLRILLESARAEGSLARAFELTYGMGLDGLEESWWGAAQK